MRYVVLESTPGYLPDDDDPPVFDEYADAVAYLNERAQEYADDESGVFTVEYGWASSGNYAAVMVHDSSKSHDLGRWIAIEIDESEDDEIESRTEDRPDYGTAWVCTDCYFAHHYGAHEHEGQWYAGESDEPADREPLCLLEGYDLADNTNSNAEDEDESGIDEFSWSSCDGCGSTLGGSRHRLAAFEQDDKPDESDGYVNEPAYGPCIVSLDGRMIGEAAEVDDAFRLLARAMRDSSYWPNVWLVNERGNTQQVVIEDFDTGTYRFGGSSYV